jgi:hypothetical protein
MLDFKKRRPWAGSVIFVLAIAAIVSFAFIYLPIAASASVSATVRLACLAAAFAWSVEALRQFKLRKLRRDIADADDHTVLRIYINDIDVGELREPVYANMRLVVANDPRNYVKQFVSLARALFHHAYLSLIVTVLLVAIYALSEWLLFPHESARTLIAIVAAQSTHGDRVAALAGSIHTVACLIAWLYATSFVVSAGVRMLFAPTPLLLSAFHDDLYRRIRLLVGTPVSGTMSISRARGI